MAELGKKQDERRANNPIGIDDDMEADEDKEEIIDEEELAMLTHLKDLKKAYRNTFQELKQVKGQLSSIQASIDHAKQQLVAQFEEWYEDNFEHSA